MKPQITRTHEMRITTSGWGDIYLVTSETFAIDKATFTNISDAVSFLEQYLGYNYRDARQLLSDIDPSVYLNSGDGVLARLTDDEIKTIEQRLISRRVGNVTNEGELGEMAEIAFARGVQVVKNKELHPQANMS